MKPSNLADGSEQYLKYNSLYDIFRLVEKYTFNNLNFINDNLARYIPCSVFIISNFSHRII